MRVSRVEHLMAERARHVYLTYYTFRSRRDGIPAPSGSATQCRLAAVSACCEEVTADPTSLRDGARSGQVHHVCAFLGPR